MPPRHLDTLIFSQELYDECRPSLAFTAATREAAEAWQPQLRRKLTQLLGGFPRKTCDLRPEVRGTTEFAAYTRETVLFQSRENLTVWAYFLKPKGFTEPGPCVICLPGHGRGVDSIVGYNEDGTTRPWGEWGEYQNDFALQCVAQGFAALAVEQLGFGHRRDEQAREGGPGNSSCQPAAGAAFLFGQTMVGWRVHDVRRAVDYLETRPDVDAQRLAVMGISGGGTITFFSAALEPRLKAAVVSGYYNTFRDSIMSIPHCIDNYVPGILNVAEMYDLAGLIAPRFLFIESGTQDSIFPVAATRRSFDRAKEIFAVFAAEDHLDKHIFRGEHQFHGERAFKFLKKWL